MKQFALAVLACLSLAVPALAAQPVPYLPVPRGAAVILNTGSTNFLGYRIVVQRSGAAEYVNGPSRATARLTPSVAERFYEDVTAAMPLSQLRPVACMKSASFGSMLFVWWHGQRSPDISCPGPATVQALAADAAAIAAALHLSATGAHTIPMLPNEPRKMLPTSAPSPSSSIR
jgi:hypothetical protein